MFTAEIIGNLGSDAVSKTINEKSYIAFDVAHSAGKDKPSIWVQVLATDYLAKRIQSYLRKGSSVFVRGNLTVSTYQTKSGETKVSLSLFANELQLLRTVEGNLVAGAKRLSEDMSQEAPVRPQHSIPLVPPGSLEPNDEDLPF